MTVISSPSLTSARVGDARPAHLRDVQQALHVAAEIDERAEIAHRGDASGHDRADDDRAPHLVGARPLFLLEQCAARDDEIPAALLELDDAELIDAPLVLRRIGVPDDIDLRDRAEGALPRDAGLRIRL